MSLTTNPQTVPVAIAIVGEGPFDLLDPFGNVFWKDMSPADTLEAAQKMGSLYRVVPATGLDYGTKVAAA